MRQAAILLFAQYTDIVMQTVFGLCVDLCVCEYAQNEQKLFHLIDSHIKNWYTHIWSECAIFTHDK